MVNSNPTPSKPVTPLTSNSGWTAYGRLKWRSALSRPGTRLQFWTEPSSAWTKATATPQTVAWTLAIPALRLERSWWSTHAWACERHAVMRNMNGCLRSSTLTKPTCTVSSWRSRVYFGRTHRVERALLFFFFSCHYFIFVSIFVCLSISLSLCGAFCRTPNCENCVRFPVVWTGLGRRGLTNWSFHMARTESGPLRRGTIPCWEVYYIYVHILCCVCSSHPDKNDQRNVFTTIKKWHFAGSPCLQALRLRLTFLQLFKTNLEVLEVMDDFHARERQDTKPCSFGMNMFLHVLCMCIHSHVQINCGHMLYKKKKAVCTRII